MNQTFFLDNAQLSKLSPLGNITKVSFPSVISFFLGALTPNNFSLAGSHEKNVCRNRTQGLLVMRQPY